jgi:hypothetical protein
MSHQLTPPPKPKKSEKGRRFLSNSKILSKNRCATTPPSFRSGSRRRSHTLRIKSYNARRTLPALRGRKDRIQSISTTRGHTRCSTSSSCVVSVARARRLLLSCKRRLSIGCAPAMNNAPPTGSRSTGREIKETTCSRMLEWAEPTTTAEPKADGTV